MVKAAFALLLMGAGGLAAFAFVFVGAGQWALAAQLGVVSAIPLLVAGAALLVATRRFGMAETGLPGLIGAGILVATAIVLYSIALKPFRSGEDEFEPSLVFLFAPIYLFVASVVVSVFVVVWSWWRHRGRTV